MFKQHTDHPRSDFQEISGLPAISKALQGHLVYCITKTLNDSDIARHFDQLTRIRYRISELIFQSRSTIEHIEYCYEHSDTFLSKYLAMFPAPATEVNVNQFLRSFMQRVESTPQIFSGISTLLELAGDTSKSLISKELLKVYEKRYEIVKSFSRYRFKYSFLRQMAMIIINLGDELQHYTHIADKDLAYFGINIRDFAEYDSCIVEVAKQRLLSKPIPHRFDNDIYNSLLSSVAEIKRIIDRVTMTSQELLSTSYLLRELIHEADSIGDRIIESQMLSTAVIAKSFSNDDENFEDLMQEAYVVLIQSFEDFNPRTGQLFSTFASRRIKDALKLCAQSLTDDQFSLRTNPMPSRLISDYIYEDFSSLPFEIEFRNQLLSEVIDKALRVLTAKQRAVLKLRYGIDVDRPHTLEEIGEKIKVSRERARQIEFSAIEKLLNVETRLIFEKYFWVRTTLYYLDKYDDLHMY